MRLIKYTYSTKPAYGFTLVEIMIVVVIIGLLAALAIPAFQKARVHVNASRIANDFRVFSGAFQTHLLETGQWAPDGSGKALSLELQEYVKLGAWQKPILGTGYWDWEYNRLGYTAGVGLALPTDWPEVMTKVDDILDDGDLTTGKFLKIGNRYLYVLE